MTPLSILKSGDLVDNLEFQGTSLAGVGTSLVFPSLDLGFDVGAGFLPATRVQNIFVSHGHMDHAGGIPYIISQKALNDLKPGIFYVPQTVAEPLKEILKLWSSIEGYEYHFSLVPVSKGLEFSLGPLFKVRPFASVHRVETYGYTVFRKRKKLKPQFTGLHQDQIREARKTGQDVEDSFWENYISFTGDTQVDILDQNPELYESKFLFIETTYFDDRKPVAEARKWGHTHLDEIVARVEKFKNEKVFLIHRSRRYEPGEIGRLIEKKMPQEFLGRFSLFL